VQPAKRLFTLKKVACRRGGRLLFQNLDCALSPGEVLHLAGPNGAGKTSLLRLMAGALPAAAGEVLWEDKPFLEKGAEEHARRIAFLPADDRSLKVLETVGENLAFWARLTGDELDCAGALGRMGLSALENTPVRRLSAGQRRRLNLARILVRKVPLWLLDEPFNGLDAAAQDLFAQALGAHAAAGGMAVIASHAPLLPPKGGSLRRLDLPAAA
jgi:heme exporter protein A